MINCWLFSYPRTGSSYLAAILNYTGKFKPIIYEWFNRYDPITKTTGPIKGQQMHQAVKWEPWKQLPDTQTLIENLPSNIKIHVFDYDLFFKKEHLRKIIQNIPNLKIIRLRRRDPFATTASFYLAEQTHVFAMSKDSEVRDHAKIKVPIIEKDLWQYYKWAIQWDLRCGQILNKTHYIETFYEDLFDKSEIHRIGNRLEINRDLIQQGIAKVQDKQCQHPQTPEIIAAIKRLITKQECQEWIREVHLRDWK